MVKKRLAFIGAAVLACASLMNGFAASAEEKRYGDFIYVPAAAVSAAGGTVSLRVEGLALGHDDAPVQIDALAGAQFGVYVISEDGELTPWANPLYPSEPMRIRTGETATGFTLPQGTEFYLRQESAPQGYLFDEAALIPVTGEEIVVRNEMPGEIVLTARDSLGNPLSGVVMTAVSGDGQRIELLTDENGEAVITGETGQTFAVCESALPEGVFAARGVSGVQTGEDGALYASVNNAQRMRVVFEHPASGAVQLNMRVRRIDDNAQYDEFPLEGVRLTVLSPEPVSIVTDEQGQAELSLLEGTYDVQLSYEGEEQILLPVSQGQTIIASGSTTMIDLTAVQTTGRIFLQTICEDAVRNGSVTLVSDRTGDLFGPYALDAEGVAVTELLEAGTYRVLEFSADDGVQFGSISNGDQTSEDIDGVVLTVEAGGVTQADIALLTNEKQTFALLAAEPDGQGNPAHTPLEKDMTLSLLTETGEEIALIDAQGGMTDVEALSGTYMLAMDEKTAQKLGVQSVSGLFELPSREEAIVFASVRSRVMITSVDENGTPVALAQYSITDAAGDRFDVSCDADGMAVTPLLAAGEAVIETKTPPQAHDAAQMVTVQVMPGEAKSVQMTHERYGVAEISVQLQSLDAHGVAVTQPLSGIDVQLYRIAGESQRMTALDMALESDENGLVCVSLEPGEYVAGIDSAETARWREPQAFRFTVENTKTVSGELTCRDALGGVRVHLIGGTLDDMQMAQVRFELEHAETGVVPMTLRDGVFYAGGLTEGTYLLRQTQMPQGYTLAGEQTVQVTGGEAAQVNVPLEECAVLSVSKTGLTFDDALRTYVVPLSGEYGVYTMEDGAMKPYPSEREQAKVWANVSAQQVALGMTDALRLPAALDGTTYYLHEAGGQKGFAEDETYYEVTLHAGETRTLDCAVSSDRGFFSLDMIDGTTGAYLPGCAFELIDPASQETVLAFETGEGAYRNAMAVPVGTYVLRQTEAAPGYALCAQPETQVVVEPYLTQGGRITPVSMTAAQIPQTQDAALIADMYVAQQQGLTLLSVDTAALPGGETLLAPTLEIQVGAGDSARTDIAGVVISGAGDLAGGSYLARVEYCLAGGGWQPSDARETGILGGPTAVSLADVHDDISAVRVTYMDALTGEEVVGSGFTPGHVTLNIEAGAQGEVNLHACAAFKGLFAYRTAFDAQEESIVRTAQRELSFAMRPEGMFDTVSAGRDGRISGVAFFDEDADGVMDAQEKGRYAGLAVSLVAQSGEVLDTVRTGSDGRYCFDTISSGTYTVQFDAGEEVVFTKGGVFSAHRISGVEDTHTGTSPVLKIDGDHTDYLVHAGCVFAGSVESAAYELTAQEQSGFGGLTVELHPHNAAADDEPMIAMTDDMGAFRFGGALPGMYEIAIQLPQGYLCAAAQDGWVRRDVEIVSGETLSLEPIVLMREAALSGVVRIDDDGDGVIDGNASGLEGVRVALLEISGGYTRQIRETTTAADGSYAFDQLVAGDYSVLFELDGEWAFTRYGVDSQVYGAVSQSGSTREIAIAPGEHRTGVNAGATIPAQLTVSVFKDTQYDGEKSNYEEMFPDVSISLIRLENGEDAEEITYKTNSEGTVVFAGVSPGEYVIAYQLPGQWRATRQVDPRSSHYPVSAVPQSTLSSGRSEPFTLSMGQSGQPVCIGAMLSGSISGRVYYDDDDDAAFGESESAFEDAKVELLAYDGTLIAETRTAADGSYAFEGLAPTRYRVRFNAPEGCGFSATERTMGRGGVQLSDENIATTRTIAVSGGSATQSADAGVVRFASVSGMIWEDRNADCLPSDGENGLEGVNVALMDGSGRTILSETTTDAEGSFVFDRLRPDTYMLRVESKEGYVFSGARSGSALTLEQERGGRGYSAPFVLLGGSHAQGVGFGQLTQGVISGLIWEDENYNGIQDEKETGLRGATVRLLDAAGAEVSRTTTIRSGEFEFKSLMPGDYALEVILGDGYVFTADGGQSLARHEDGNICVIPAGTLAMGGEIQNLCVGAIAPAGVSGVVWLDEDDDGRRAYEDTGVAGVRAVLTMISGADSGKRYETLTDETGAYSFEGVMPGSAEIEFTLEPGHAFARQISGTKRVSSVPQTDALTAKTGAISLVSGTVTTDIDVGVVGVGAVSGRVWADNEYDGRMGSGEGGVPGAQIELLDAASGKAVSSVLTNENGEYSIGFVRMGTYSIRVTLPDNMIFTMVGESAVAGFDVSAACTQNLSVAMGESFGGVNIGAISPASLSGSVIVDTNGNGLCEAGESGLSGVNVTVMQGGTVVAAAQTGADGSYAFGLLRPGTYRLRFAPGEKALFAQQTTLNVAHADAAEGETGVLTLAAGAQMQSEPVAVVMASEICGRAFVDDNVNGMPEAAETAMAGVQVELLDGNGGVIARTETAADGAYAFDRLRSGVYALRFTIEDGMLYTDYTGQPGASCAPVVQGAVSQTQTFPLAMGERKADMHVGGILPGSIGDTVWLDVNGNGLQDYKEPLISGAKLTLMRADGEVVATQSSDEYGYYAFEMLRPGEYVLAYEQREGDTLTFSFGDPLEEIDSDLDPQTGKSAVILLHSGQKLRSADVGFTDYAQ